MPVAYTGIWLYAICPNHFASDYNTPNKPLGELLVEKDAKQLAQLIRYMKGNDTIMQLQKEFFDRADNPLLK
jgi:hypothetical protein